MAEGDDRCEKRAVPSTQNFLLQAQSGVKKGSVWRMAMDVNNQSATSPQYRVMDRRRRSKLFER